MRHAKEESSCSSGQAIAITSAVKGLHGFSSKELNKMLWDSEHFTIHYLTKEGSTVKIDVEKLARCLHLHLMAIIVSAPRDEALFRYLLCGTRLLHSLVDLAPRHAKLEQILLDDVKVSKQLLDRVLHLLIVLGAYKQWQDLAVVLLAFPKVDLLVDLEHLQWFVSGVALALTRLVVSRLPCLSCASGLIWV